LLGITPHCCGDGPQARQRDDGFVRVTYSDYIHMHSSFVTTTYNRLQYCTTTFLCHSSTNISLLLPLLHALSLVSNLGLVGFTWDLAANDPVPHLEPTVRGNKAVSSHFDILTPTGAVSLLPRFCSHHQVQNYWRM